MRTKQDTREIVELFKKEYPLAECSLTYEDAWQLLVSVRLSAQCTDARVNIVTKDLFAQYPTLETLAAAGPQAIEAIIKPCGLGHSKARDLDGMANMLLRDFGGQVPQSMEDLLKTELFIKTVIGIGTVSSHLRELADSYKEAQTAIDVGKVFDTEKTIINYENLGIGRLIYQLPTTLCEIFLTEVFKKNSIDSLDQETLFTINKFFENNLNVSETSRKLFVHRNTLVYRLEKIKKLTGLDLRQFDHAIIFKVALMVRKYLSSRDIHPA